MSRRSLALFILSSVLTLAGCGTGSNGGLIVYTTSGAAISTDSADVGLVAVVIGSSQSRTDVSSQVLWNSSSPELVIKGASARCTDDGDYVVTAHYQAFTASTSLACQGVRKIKPSPPVIAKLPVTLSPETPVSVAPITSAPVVSPPIVSTPVSNPPVTSVATAAPASIIFTNPVDVVRSEAPYSFDAEPADANKVVIATSEPSGAFKWAVDSNIATVSQAGTVHCNNSGAVVVTATLGNLSSSTSFTCLLHHVDGFRGLTDAEERFDGPFVGWKSVKDFGAVGDGTADDTAAFAAAVTYMSSHQGVLWVPHGTYVLSNSITAWNWQYSLMVGEDPRNTSLVWKGPSTGDVILRCASCVEATFKRLTLDGNNKVAVGIRLDGGGDYYPTKTSLQDLHISNVGRDVQIGYAAEISIKRVYFDHPSFAGVSVENWDAANINVVDSLFVGATWGVTNIAAEGGAGSFNVSNCVFVNSVSADLANGNSGVFTGRNNISIGANLFFLSGAIGSPSQVTLENNEVISPLADPLEIDNPGTVTLIDNVFRSVPKSYPVLIAKGQLGVNVLAIGNHYEMDQPYTGNLLRLSTALEARSTLDATPYVAPANVFVPEKSGRPIFEIPANANSAVVQAVLNRAMAAGSGVIHVPLGSTNIATTLTLSGDADIALVGDGSYSYLGGTPDLVGPVLTIEGSHVEVKDLSVASLGEAIKIVVPDSPGDSVFCDECHTSYPAYGMWVDSLDNTRVEARMSLLNGMNYGVVAYGGDQQNAGTPTLSRVATLMTSSNNYLVDRGSHFTLTDGFHDWHQGSNQFVFAGNGFLTHQGSEILTALPGGMQLQKASGDVTLIGDQIDTTLAVDGFSSARVLLAGALQTSGSDPIANGNKQVQALHIGDQTNVGNGYPSPIADDAIQSSAMERALSDARTVSDMPKSMYRPGRTRVRLNKVLVNFATTAFHITSSHGATPPNVYQVTSVSSGKDLSECLGNGAKASWSLTDGHDGSFALSNGGLYISEQDGTTTGPRAVASAMQMDSASQRWFVQAAGDGSFSITNRASGLALSSMSTGGCVTQAKTDTNPNQKWVFGTQP